MRQVATPLGSMVRTAIRFPLALPASIREKRAKSAGFSFPIYAPWQKPAQRLSRSTPLRQNLRGNTLKRVKFAWGAARAIDAGRRLHSVLVHFVGGSEPIGEAFSEPLTQSRVIPPYGVGVLACILQDRNV